MNRVTAAAAIIGWIATIVLFGQSGLTLAVPALAGWSISAVIGIDVTRRHEHVPAIIALTVAAAAALFVGLAFLAL